MHRHDAESATVAEAQLLVRTEEFDLVIVSSVMSQKEKSSVISAAGETPTLVLHGITFPLTLLAEVERLLASASER
jgi:hypothetical protein